MLDTPPTEAVASTNYYSRTEGDIAPSSEDACFPPDCPVKPDQQMDDNEPENIERRQSSFKRRRDSDAGSSQPMEIIDAVVVPAVPYCQDSAIPVHNSERRVPRNRERKTSLRSTP